MVYALAVGAAALFGLGSAVQQRAAARAPSDMVLKWQLLWYLVHRRQWLAGVVTSLLGNVLAGVALGRGGVALVQPLLVSRRLFALPAAAAWERRRLSGREWGGAIAVAAGLATFLVASEPTPGTRSSPPIWSWLVTAGAIGALIPLVVRLARRLRPPFGGAGARRVRRSPVRVAVRVDHHRDAPTVRPKNVDRIGVVDRTTGTRSSTTGNDIVDVAF